MTTNQRTGGVESARKALLMLLHFTEEHPRATADELARAVGVPKSTAYRHLALLRELGLIDEGTRGVYHVTARAGDLARAADAAGGLIVRARPYLRRVAEETGETTVLVRLLGDAAVTVDQVESNHAVRLAYSPGRTMPLTAGAPAKLLLASLPASTRTAYLDRMCKADPDFARIRPEWEAALAPVRRQGWADSWGEVDPGLWGCAAAVQERGRVVAALSSAAPLARLGTDEARRFVLESCIRGAKDISAALAG